MYYAQAVNSTMLMALNTITMGQAAPMKTMIKNTEQFLDNASTNKEATITHQASNMILAVHSNASYLNKPQSRSRAGGAFFQVMVQSTTQHKSSKQ